MMTKGKENERRVARRTHYRLVDSRYKEHPSIKHGFISQGLGGRGQTRLYLCYMHEDY
jgi:hypothetical protein